MIIYIYVLRFLLTNADKFKLERPAPVAIIAIANTANPIQSLSLFI